MHNPACPAPSRPPTTLQPCPRQASGHLLTQPRPRLLSHHPTCPQKGSRSNCCMSGTMGNSTSAAFHSFRLPTAEYAEDLRRGSGAGWSGAGRGRWVMGRRWGRME